MSGYYYWNKICGKVLREDQAEHMLGLTTFFLNNITRALASDEKINWSSQTASTWEIRSSNNADPLDEAIADAKSIVASAHVSFYEDFKAIKYNALSWTWPDACPAVMDQESLWARFWWAMDQDQHFYRMRNWCSHDLGVCKTTLADEMDMFQKLLESYRDFLPVVEELVGKLKHGVEDKAAW
ncbi:hypothetical protein T440DRAFT_403228, partial [Plenodomus tracheiphilus IPT5]